MDEVKNEFDDLPDDPKEAFGILERRLYAHYRATESDNYTSSDMREAKEAYVTILSSFSEVHDLHLYATFSPKTDTNDDFAEFVAISRRSAAKFLIRCAKNRKEYEQLIVDLDADEKQTIHALIGEIRARIESLHIDKRKKDSLLSKLNAFEAEVDRSRTRTEMFFALVAEASRAAREVGENIKPFEHAFDRISEIIDKAKGYLTALPGLKAPKQIEHHPAEPASATDPESEDGF